jgi:ribosomal protein L11 methyltransferase
MGGFWWSVELAAESPADDPGNFGDSPPGWNSDEFFSVIADLSGSIGAEIFEEDGEQGKITVMRAAYVSSRDISHWLSVLEGLLENFSCPCPVRVRSYAKIENRPWHTEHLDAFPPLSVGVNLTVLAPWHRGKEPEGRVPLYIYPSSAFGTGYHESTQIALTLVERFVRAGDTVIDVGTGSGVLFIAALKLGAGKAAARDIDPTAIAEARRNMELNDVSPGACDLRVGDLLEGIEGAADILTANILLEPNMRLLESAGRVLRRPSGIAIFSGMTVSERAKFLSALPLTLLAELTVNGWWGCAAKI